MPFCQRAGHSLPWANCSCSLTFFVRAGNGMGSLLQYIPDQERRERRIGFEDAGNRAGDDGRRETCSFYMLVVWSDELQFRDATSTSGIALHTVSKKNHCFTSDH